MRRLHHWIKSHPYKALMFANGFTLISACTAVVGGHYVLYFVGLFVVLLVVWAATFYADNLP